MPPAPPPEFNSDMKPIRALLGDATGFLVVPDYQRHYSWEREEFEVFWQDLTSFAWDDSAQTSTYFLGAIILVKETELEILDGQQRIATLTILLSSLARFFDTIGDRKLHGITTRHLKNEQTSGPDLHYLRMNDLDEYFFKNYVQEYRNINPSTTSHRNIAACKNYFDEQLDLLKTELSEADAKAKALRLLETIRDNVYVLVLITSDFEDAADVFEKLNDRGIQLATVDLVRMLLLGNCATDERQEIMHIWQEILTMDDKANADSLLRYHWIGLEGDPTGSRLYRIIKPKIQNMPNFSRKTGTYEPLAFTRDLGKSAEIYREIYAAREGDTNYTDVASYTVNLNARPLIPLLLKIYELEDERDQIARVAFTTYVRNRLIGGLSSTEFETLVYGVAKDITADNTGEQIDRLITATRSDEEFLFDFSTANIKVQKQTAYILREIEKNLRDDPNAEVKPPVTVHVEHIYPRSPEQNHLWDDHDDWVHRLGNQTLLLGKRNQKAQNALFPKKKHLYCHSDLKLNEYFESLKKWTEADIAKRQKMLAEIAIRVWPIER